MVFDTIGNASLYYGLGPRFQQALEWIQRADISAMEPGQRVDIDGDELYATYFDLNTAPRAESMLEGHRDYADIQYLMEGRERVGYALRGTMPSASEYTPDIQFYRGDWDMLTLNPGCFYIVWPQDLHAPRVAVGLPERVKRLVVKVRLPREYPTISQEEQ